MDKRILIPTDFSKNALNAVKYAMDFYRHHSCDFYLLNVYHVSGYSIDSMMVPEPGEQAYEAAREASEEGMKKFMEMVRLHGEEPNYRFHTISSFNSLAYGIKNIIEKKDIDLIVMGTKGITNREQMLFGTNTILVMEQITECPVLAVPDEVAFSVPREIVFPTDYKTGFKRRELNYLLGIAQEFETVIHVLHVEEEPELTRDQLSNKELLQEILKGVPYEIHTMSGLKVHKAIGAFVTSRSSDMIAFMNRRHSFLGKLLSRPLVKELGAHFNIPVLELNDTRS